MRASFVISVVLCVVLVVVVEKKTEGDHIKEVAEQKAQNGEMSTKIDKLLDIQSRIPIQLAANLSPDDWVREVGSLKDDQARIRIALDSIVRRLDKPAEAKKDDLRTRTLQTSKDLLAFLYQYHCDVDRGLTPTDPDLERQIFANCTTRMRAEYYKTHQDPTLQIIDELEKRGLDAKHVRFLAQSGWNNTIIERVAIELLQLAERLPKTD